MTKKQKKNLIRILAAAALMILLAFLPVEGWLRFLLYLIPYLTVGGDVLKKAFRGIRNHQVFDENFLMSVATIGAILLGEYVEGVAVMLFYQIGELFQSYAVGKSRKNITQLMDIRPDYANVIREDGSTETVDPDEVETGSLISVAPGEKIPIDGIVAEGHSTLNTSALTGESLPRDVREGEEVISGCINMTGLLKIKTTREFGESTVSKILEMVENASSRKSRSEAFISRFAHYYTPVVCYSALALAILPPLVRVLFLHLPANIGDWVFRALTFLVISCPCALVISIPLTFFAGIGGASAQGVLVKGSNYLEALSQTQVVLFDKTGTLTRGAFDVTGIHHSVMEEKRLLEFAALVESYSTHPISRSLQAAYEKYLPGETEEERRKSFGEEKKTRVSDVEEISGKGVKALVDGIPVAAGNLRLMEELGLSCDPCGSVGTVVYVAVDGSYAGHILISDQVKEGAAEAISLLKASGIEKTVMLTGDRKETAEEVAKQLGVDEVHAELLPGDKVAKVEEYSTYKTAFVGDGINDAPVLSRADVGIAMGAMGSDAAIEAADVVLMDDDPRKISKAIRIARKCMRIVYENITFAIGIKVICLILGALGYANMWIAIFADVGVMVLAVLNAIRALRVKNL